MNLTKDDLLQIENHIKNNIASWIEDTSLKKSCFFNELELFERIVRVEEELKSQRELMMVSSEQSNKRFEQMDRRFEDIQKYMDKRFEQMDRRFEDINSRFTMMFTFMSLGFTILAAMMTIFKFLV